MSHDSLPRRRFLTTLAGLCATGAALPSILARLRHQPWANNGPIVIRDSHFVAESPVWVTLHTNQGTYKAPIIDGVADFTHMVPHGGPLYIHAMDANGSPYIPAQLKL